jgi:endonuclease/exonuclease/phosphatase (EEP) superfamily protein YafD
MDESAAGPVIRRRTFLRRMLLPTWAERKQMFALEAWIVVGTAYLAILFAYVLPQDFRATGTVYVSLTWVALMIRTFLFHFGLFLSVIFVTAAILRRRRLLLVTLPVLIFALGPDVWNYVPGQRAAVDGEAITVLTANLLYANRDTAPLVAEVRAADADVVLLQEYTPAWQAAVRPALAAKYPYVQDLTREDAFGWAIYSKYPFDAPVNANLTLGNWGTPQMRAVLQINGRPVAFYNVHLLPPRTLPYMTGQREEFADLLDVLRAERLPIVLCGDFNFTNRSPFAAELARLGLRDVHQISGWGRGATWPVTRFFRALPGIRLDHIYISHELTSPACDVGFGHGSDHRPVTGTIGFRAATGE